MPKQNSHEFHLLLLVLLCFTHKALLVTKDARDEYLSISKFPSIIFISFFEMNSAKNLNSKEMKTVSKRKKN